MAEDTVDKGKNMVMNGVTTVYNFAKGTAFPAALLLGTGIAMNPAFAAPVGQGLLSGVVGIGEGASWIADTASSATQTISSTATTVTGSGGTIAPATPAPPVASPEYTR